MGIEATGLKARSAYAAPAPAEAPTPCCTEGLRVRDRLAQALTCPWCHDDVERSAQSVVCTRDGCGALYHDACWEDCRELHGACAVFGCNATEAEEVTQLGYLVRLLGLLIAALLLPPRVLRSLRELEEEGVGAVYTRTIERVEPLFLSLDPGENSFTKLAVYAFASIPLSGALLSLLLHPVLWIPGVLALPFLVALFTLCGPPLIACGAALLYAVAACLARCLRSELGALGLRGPARR